MECAIVKDGAGGQPDAEMEHESGDGADWSREESTPSSQPAQQSVSSQSRPPPRTIVDNTEIPLNLRTAVSREGGYQDPKFGRQLRAEVEQRGYKK